jgi:hypothetical protein
MRISIVLLFAVLANPALADTEMYKWTDKDGTVHFSDQPAPGAEKIKVQNVSTVASPPVKDTLAPTQPVDFSGYKSFKIASPANGAAFYDNTGTVTVSLALDPALRVDLGHTVKVSVDGKSQGGAASSFTFSGIDRGAHSITAVVLDKDQKPLKSASSAFTLHKNSILTNPTNKPK